MSFGFIRIKSNNIIEIEMNTKLLAEKGNVKMIAHRGVSGLERENTCAAFVTAGVKSYYGVETDMRITKDGKFAIIHDGNLSRVGGGNVAIDECTFAEIRKARLKDTDDVTVREDLCVPSLQEYIAICRKYDKQCILELKVKMTKEQLVQMVELIQSMGWLERTTIISFSRDNLILLRSIYPNVDIQFLTTKCGEEEIELMAKHRFDADLWDELVTKELVDTLHEKGIKVNCWTVDDLETAERVRDCGVDFITTDIIE